MVQSLAGEPLDVAKRAAGNPGGACICTTPEFPDANPVASTLRVATGCARGGCRDGGGFRLWQRWLGIVGQVAIRTERHITGACFLQPAARGAVVVTAMADDSRASLAAWRAAGYECLATLAPARMARPARGFTGRYAAGIHVVPDQLCSGINTGWGPKKHDPGSRYLPVTAF